jgi:non-specific serine/threonine protein kinase
MLFDQERKEPKKTGRPVLPKDFVLSYEIGFLFNFVSSKSTRFDLEPVLIYKVNSTIEYKRISLQVEKGLAFLQPLDDAFGLENLITYNKHLSRYLRARRNLNLKSIAMAT